MPNVEVVILVPEERVGEFYRMYGEWLEGEKPKAAAAPKAERARRKRPERQRPSGGGSGRYEPLVDYLAQQAHEGPEEIELKFGQIENILGVELPNSARSHRAWWANSASNARAAGWMNAGWRMANIDLEGERVRFERSS